MATTLQGIIVFHFKAQIEMTNGSIFGGYEKYVFPQGSFWRINSQLPNTPILSNVSVQLDEIISKKTRTVPLGFLGMLLLANHPSIVLMTYNEAVEMIRKESPVNV